MRVAVIGAGAAGLVTARELRSAGHVPVVFERASHVGGTWVYDERTEDDPLGKNPSTRLHASMYAALRTNLPRPLMSFSGHPFVGDGREFPGHAAVAQYLADYAAAENLTGSIRFGHGVQSVVPLMPDGRSWRHPSSESDVVWQITVTHRGDASAETFDAVAVCNGHYTVPNVPPLPGLELFPGEVLHSHNYRRRDPFADRVVAMLGAKASGFDLSRDVAEVATRVHLCARDHDGVATVGANHNIDLRSSIVALHDDASIELTDGSRIVDVDDVILCTGYRYDFPFLDPSARIVDVVDNNVEPLWLMLVAVRLPSIAFVGLPFQVVPFALFERQAAFFAALLSGRISPCDPETREAQWAAREAELVARGVARRHFLRLGDEQVEYGNLLARRCGAPPLPEWFGPLHRAVQRMRREHPDDYRDRPIPVVGGLGS